MKTYTHKSSMRRVLLASAATSLMALSATYASAQTSEDTIEDEVTVTGTRAVIQDSIALKRNSVQIVDGLSADEIGDLPALSIGEALEAVSGVAGHRENGGATEVSIRGLGPYLSSTTFNGRAITNGSGDRSVNFSQFPSELLNKLAIFKTQDASQIEGGVAGQVQIETLNPLDYGKQRFQFDLKGNVNPDQFNIENGQVGDVGFRGTASYVDQFEFNNGSSLGISIGGQISDISQPEAEARTSTPDNTVACLVTNGLAQYTDQTNGGTFTGFSNNPETRDRGDDDCDDFNNRRNAANTDTRGSSTEGYDTTLVDGVAIDDGTPFAFVTSSRSFRQNDTNDKRNSLFGTVQFQPNDKLDIVVDGQFSELIKRELRSDILFTGVKRNDNSIPGTDATSFSSLVVTDSGAVLQSLTQGAIESHGVDFEREENYLGGGAAVSYDYSDRLTLSADVSYSNTERTEIEKQFRLQSNISPAIAHDNTGDVHQFALSGTNFDVRDHDNYIDRLRVRIDNDGIRENTITAGRFDVDYVLDNGFLTDIKAGVRFGRQEYGQIFGGSTGDGSRTEFEIEDNGEFNIQGSEVIDQTDADDAPWLDVMANVNQSCRSEFKESGFLSTLRNGDLITGLDGDGNAYGTNSWATFDANCVFDTSVSGLNAILDQLNSAEELNSGVVIGPFSSAVPGLVRESQNTVDVQEDTLALYAMSDYETEMAGLPVRGNIGLRVVNTKVESTGFRNAFTVIESGDTFSLVTSPDFETIVVSHDYTEFLPSITAIVDYNDDTLLRFGMFRAMSRADPGNMGLSRNFITVSEEDDEPNREDLVSGVRGNGNPKFDPLMSWNFDAGVEWYPNPDSLFAISTYYKTFQGGFENIQQIETYDIDGVNQEFTVSTQQVSDEESTIFGVELSAAHSLSYLPGYWSGLGFKVNYNYADSDFELEDRTYGDRFQRLLDGSVVQTNAGIVPPASLAGLSEHVAFAQIYYQIGNLDLQGNYKYRSEYFHPSITDSTSIRYVGASETFEARASYKINKNFRVQIEALNLFDDPKEQFAFVRDNRYEVNQYGPRVFVGLRGRF